MRDALGYEELGQAGSQVASMFITGSAVVVDQITSGQMISGLNLFSAGSVSTAKVIASSTINASSFISGLNLFSAGSVQTDLVVGDVAVSGLNVYGAGSIQAPLFTTAKDVVWTTGSPFNQGVIIQMTTRSIISGGMWVTASGNLALAGPASAQAPLGVAQATAGSNATVNIITHGIVPMVAEGTIGQGVGVIAGAGGALNCVVAAGAGSGMQFAALDAAGSAGTVFVFIK